MESGVHLGFPHLLTGFLQAILPSTPMERTLSYAELLQYVFVLGVLVVTDNPLHLLLGETLSSTVSFS